MQIHGVVWVLIRADFVLLEQCEKKARVLGYPNEWFLPGGKIEEGETVLGALQREIAEEWPSVKLLWTIPLPIVEGSAVPPGPKGIFLMRPYRVEISGEVPMQSSEGTPLRWVRVDKALKSPVPQVRMMVAAANEARLFVDV